MSTFEDNGITLAAAWSAVVNLIDEAQFSDIADAGLFAGVITREPTCMDRGGGTIGMGMVLPNNQRKIRMSVAS